MAINNAIAGVGGGKGVGVGVGRRVVGGKEDKITKHEEKKQRREKTENREAV